MKFRKFLEGRALRAVGHIAEIGRAQARSCKKMRGIKKRTAPVSGCDAQKNPAWNGAMVTPSRQDQNFWS
ncbi:hypothetical protein KR767_16330 [Luteibacter anthropi]|uniref:hypothetical protein n=1 Tax=Luteibacter anthropi TaxID=564369 RepID=UPI0020331B02|nr:hypothetical protein [Luteibacter anthropi]URX61616.1 hypothetical protein KR767_16330 [Luteibacter anthropi]